MQVSDDRFQAESGWNIVTPLGSVKLSSAECTVENSMMMGREDARNM
jgi:hypothetical protein